MLERITLDMLTVDYVSVKKEKFIVQDNIEYPVGQPWRRLYENSINGREQVQDEVPEPYKSVIFLMWGDNPTVVDTAQ